MTPQPRCHDCGAWATAMISEEYDPNDENAPRRCNTTGVYVLPMCFCLKFEPNRGTWRPAITIDDLAKINKAAADTGVEVRLRFAPYGDHWHKSAVIISAGPSDEGIVYHDHKKPSYRRPITEMWGGIIYHWRLGTVEWRPAP